MKTGTEHKKGKVKAPAILTCPDCGKTFRGPRRSQARAVHRKSAHGIAGESPAAVDARKKRAAANALMGEDDKKCSLCFATFKSPAGRKIHEGLMHHEKIRSNGGNNLNGNRQGNTAVTVPQEIDGFSFSLGQICTHVETLVAAAAQRERVPEELYRARIISFLSGSGSPLRRQRRL